MNPEVEAHFKLVGEFEPETVTTAMGLSPSRTWRAGERLGTSLIAFDTDGWRVTAGPRRTLDAGELIQELLLLLAPNGPKLAELRAQMKLKTILTVRIYITLDQDSAPDLYVEDDLMRQLADLNTALDIDIMLLGPDESPPID